MQPIGFSTGALAKGDFRKALQIIQDNDIDVVELSCLRLNELGPLMEALPDLDLHRFRYVSIHAPGGFSAEEEKTVLQELQKAVLKQIPVVVHPDSIFDFHGWEEMGKFVLLENMDRRKPVGRSVPELRPFFDRLPEAGFCLDLGHARQFDPSMTIAVSLSEDFKDRLRQLHVSEVNSFSRHERLSWLSWFALRRINGQLFKGVPIVLESPVEPKDIDAEISFALDALRLT